MNLYKEYLKEREGKGLHVLDDKGFLVYAIQDVENEKIIYIQDIYVREQFRKHNVAKRLK